LKLDDLEKQSEQNKITDFDELIINDLEEEPIWFVIKGNMSEYGIIDKALAELSKAVEIRVEKSI
jgi:hypothetical protein